MLVALLNPGTADILQLVTSAAATIDVHATYAEKVITTEVVSEGRTNTAITTAATTTILAGPASGSVRTLKCFFARNKHATLACDLTVVHNINGGTAVELHKVTLNAGEMLQFIEGVGFWEVTLAQALDKRLRVVSDVTNATTSFADVTGLTCPLLSGKHYNFIAFLMHSTDATTTGARFGINIGAAPTGMAIHGESQITSSVTAAAQGQSVMVTARDTAIVVETTGPGTANMLCKMCGWIQPSADGIFAIRSQSEVAVANALVIRAGSWCRIWEATG